MNKDKAPRIWFKTPRQVHQYLTCPIGDAYVWGDPKAPESAVKDKGIVYEIGEKSVYNHTKPNTNEEIWLKANRGGCFAKRTVDIYARTHVHKVVVGADPTEESVEELTGTQGVAAARMEADAAVKQATAQLKALELKRELGQTVSTAVAEREAGEKAQAIKLHLSSFMRDFAPELLSHVGGDIKVSREIVDIVGGDEDMAEKLSGFIYSRRPLLLETFQRRLKEALNVYARGEWFTEEMREAWEKLENYRKETEVGKMMELIAVVDGDPAKLAVAIEKFEVCEREVL